GLIWRGASAERSATQAEAWVETIEGRAYVVFETVSASGSGMDVHYIDVGDTAPGGVSAWTYDVATGDLAVKLALPGAPTVADAIASGVSAAELRAPFDVAINTVADAGRVGDVIQLLGRLSSGGAPVVIATKVLTADDLSGVSFRINPGALSGFATEGAKVLTSRIVSARDGTGAESAALKLTVDTTAPTATIDINPDRHVNGAIAEITFSEAVTGFSLSVLSMDGGVITGFETSDNRVFRVSFKPTAGESTISIEGDFADVAGNTANVIASETYRAFAPSMYAGISSLTIDEDKNNSGSVVAPLFRLSDFDNQNFAGGFLKAQIGNRVEIPDVAGERLEIRGLSDGSVFFRAVGDKIYFRQGVSVDANGAVTTSDTNPGDDIWIGSIARINGVRQDGSNGEDLRIDLNENATVSITQVLASNIVFAIKLSNGGLTEAWQDFAGSGTSVIFEINDGQGSANRVQRLLNVVANNDAPVAVSDAQAISQSAIEPATGNVLANDTDPDNVPGLTQQTLTVADVTYGGTQASFSNHSATLQGAYGVLTMSDTGAYSYVLDQRNAQVSSLLTGESLVETFAYNVSDGAAQASSTLAITINGTAINVPPVANADQSFASNAGGAASGNVLTNDTDANGHSLHVTSVPSGVVGASFTGQYGTLTLKADGSYTYKPDTTNETVQALVARETVTDSFNYSISDGHDGTASSTLVITINGVTENTAPNGYSDEARGTTYAAMTGNVLTNDIDSEAQTLTVNGAAVLEHGLIDVGAGGVTIAGAYGDLQIFADGDYV
ncbi:MAG: outer rane adhesin like protein, partial [Hyphomicrobiales bacterium]|nr:outer rane adhesin like protein [Hyphomicrobiales bacterium]